MCSKNKDISALYLEISTKMPDQRGQLRVFFSQKDLNKELTFQQQKEGLSLITFTLLKECPLRLRKSLSTSVIMMLSRYTLLFKRNLMKSTIYPKIFCIRYFPSQYEDGML